MIHDFRSLGLVVALMALIAVPASGQASADPQVTAPVERERQAQRRQRDRGGDPSSQVERITRTLSLPAGGEVMLSNVSGDIVVTGGDGRDVVIDITKRARRRRDAREQLASVDVEIRERGNRIEVRTDRRSGRRSRVSVNYDVRVPRDARISVRSVSGDITASDVDGDLRAVTVSGNIDAKRVHRLVLVKSVSGDLHLGTVGAEDDVRLSCVSGDVDVRDLTARRVSIETVSGDLDLTNMRVDRLDMHSVSGEIAYDGVLAEDGRYSVNTHSGDVRLVLGGQVGFELEASSFSGTVRSDLPVILPERAVDDTRARRRRAQNIQGTYGNGSARLEISTFSGDIEITRR